MTYFDPSEDWLSTRCISDRKCMRRQFRQRAKRVIEKFQGFISSVSDSREKVEILDVSNGVRTLNEIIVR